MKILLPLSSSERTQKNVDYVKTVAKKLDAEIILMNVVVIPAEMMGVADESTLLKDGEEFVEANKKQLEEEGIKVSTKVSISTCSAGLSIVRAAEELKVDLIALGAKGKSLKRNLLIGSVADSVLKDATCPVLIIK